MEGWRGNAVRKPLAPVSNTCLNDEMEQPRIVDWPEAVMVTSHRNELGQVDIDSDERRMCTWKGSRLDSRITSNEW